MELEVQVVDGQIQAGKEVTRALRKLQEFQVTIQEMKNEEAEIKEAIFNAMEQNGIKSASLCDEQGDICKIIYVNGSTRKTADSKALKEAGLFDLYCKESTVKPTLKIEYK